MTKVNGRGKFASLRDYLELVENEGLLKRVEGADWNLEIGALSEIIAFSKSPKVLLFDSIKGYSKGFRVATNLYSSQTLQAFALGLPPTAPGVQLVQSWREKSRQLEPLKPKVAQSGSVLENVMRGDEIDVLRFPVPKWHENDGGRYIGTGDLVMTRDPDDGWINMGVYRCMVQDRRTVSMQISPTHHGGIMMEKYWSKGEDAPVAVALGQDPYLYAAACSPLPWGKSELEYASALKGEPIEVIVDPDVGLPIPANAEIAIVGHVPPIERESKQEGPFGECWGYYTGPFPERVLKIDKILFRNDPILQGSPTMHGSARMHSLGAELTTSASIWDSIEREVPNVKGVFSLYQPCQAGSTILVVSIKQSYAGHSIQAGLSALAAHATIMLNRAVIVVDEDVDPSNFDDVLFAVTSRCIPDRDIRIIGGTPTAPVDSSVPRDKREINDLTSSTMIIDATRKPYPLRNTYPKTNAISANLRQEMVKKWGLEFFEK